MAESWAERLAKVKDVPQVVEKRPVFEPAVDNKASLPPLPVKPADGRRRLVVDTGAFIRLKDLAGELFVTVGVAAEIRDMHARKRLGLMRDVPRVQGFGREDMQYARQFAAMTGDLKVLSATDLEVIAATVRLFREYVGAEKLNMSPFETSVVKEDVAFEWAPKHADDDTQEMDEDESPHEHHCQTTTEDDTNDDNNGFGLMETSFDSDDDSSEVASRSGADAEIDGIMKPVGSMRKNEILTGYHSDSDDGEGEWITANNLHNFGVVTAEVAESEIVACVTGDYAMQNVLMQMGIPIVTVDGRRVRSVRLWGFKCSACFTFTRDSSKHFCPGCGNHTLNRVPISVEDGKVTVHHRARVKPRLRGTIYNIPMHKGGRHDKPPILSEDQLKMFGREKEFKYQQNKWAKEREIANPFGGVQSTDACGWWEGRRRAVAPKVKIGLGPGNPNSKKWQRERGKIKKWI